jgi:hypothetical protein
MNVSRVFEKTRNFPCGYFLLFKSCATHANLAHAIDSIGDLQLATQARKCAMAQCHCCRREQLRNKCATATARLYASLCIRLVCCKKMSNSRKNGQGCAQERGRFRAAPRPTQRNQSHGAVQ